MEGAFAWLNEIFRRLLALVPSFEIMTTRRAGVAFVRGKPKPIAPGSFVMYWPFWTELHTVAILPQTLDLRAQTIMARHEGKLTPVALSGIVVYHVTDATKALTVVHDPDEAITDLALASIKTALWGRELSDIYDDSVATDKAIRDDLAGKVSGFGVKIRSVFLDSLSTAFVLAQMGGAAGVVPVTDDE